VAEARSLIAEVLTDTRVVTLNGARQAGKSTLARLAALGPRLMAGYVLYTGQQTLSFGDRLRALPSTPSGMPPPDCPGIQTAPHRFGEGRVTKG